MTPKLTDRVRVQRPAADPARDESGQVVDEWEAVADCWAKVEGLAGQQPGQGEQVVGQVAHKVTVLRDALPGLDAAGTRWRVLVLVLGGRPLDPPRELRVREVGVPAGPLVALVCRGEQRR